MGVCTTVADLADLVEISKAVDNPRHRLLIRILKLMPLYLEIGDLSAWESAFQGALEDDDDESAIGKLLWEVFELGRCSMYCAFSKGDVERDFLRVRQMMVQEGIAVNLEPDLSCW